ncbi:hypothetical protein ACJMK2_010557 [Sinanodonta woodiana]|uniref:Kelch domain-containing protein 4 n=1 Tax=Sinanodonta woodiana TaxID=1069815 RepID=A0ABD3VHB8_SINWO
MGKKNKKDKKGKGIEKTIAKTEKKAEKKAMKELAEKGEEDIEKLLAEFQEIDRKKTEIIEEKCSPPSPRCNMTLTAHPDKEELIMFGGEYFTGKKMFMYNDLLFYNIKKNEWMKVTGPRTPPPRSGHQAVALKQEGGQLWIFGGEFASPTQAQFYHYKDLWVYHIKTRKWEKIDAPGGPSARSGHRMVNCKKQLIVFGGFHDNIRNYKYFNDVYAFNLETYTWTKINPSGNGPAPRSGCVMASFQDNPKILIYGGYSKENVKRDVERGQTHTDMFVLMPEGKKNDESMPDKWKWQLVKQSGVQPSARSGMPIAVAPGNKAICFGGVFDEEDDDEKLTGIFFNDMFCLEMDKGKWYSYLLRGKKMAEKKRRRKKKDAAKSKGDDNEEYSNEEGSEDEPMEIPDEEVKNLSLKDQGSSLGEVTGEDNTGAVKTVVIDGVFKVTVGQQGSSSAEHAQIGSSEMEVDIFMPSPRMNALLAIKSGVLFLYGGIVEEGDKQVTLTDFYSLDINKQDEWNTLIEQDGKSQVWEDSESSSDEEGEQEGACGGEEEEEEDSEDEMEITFDDAPTKEANEETMDYFVRTRDYWMGKAQTYCETEGLELTAKKLEKLATEMCNENNE